MSNGQAIETVCAIQDRCLYSCDDSVYREFRHLAVDRPAMQEWVHRHDPFPRQMDGYDLYFGVLPRGKDHQPVDHAHVLWADFDKRDEFLFRAMAKFKVQPNVIVDSGRGFHTYWYLKEPMANDIASTVMKGIARFHGGDHVHDAARILRVPNTINRKNGALARVIRSTRTYHDWDEFIDYAEAGRDRELFVPSSKTYPVEGWISDEDIPGWLVKLLDEDPGKGRRSEHAYRVVCSLIELGAPFSQIVEIFDENQYGVGAKFHEKKNHGERWLKTTYEAALRNGVRPT